MQDGLTSEEVKATSVVASYTSAGAGEIGTTEQGFVQARGFCLQTGEGVMASGSAWVAFGSKFQAVPDVVAVPSNAAAVAGALDVVSIKSVVAGSFHITGSPQTGSFYYLAVGSGGYT
jgi:hypothetical protein